MAPFLIPTKQDCNTQHSPSLAVSSSILPGCQPSLAASNTSPSPSTSAAAVLSQTTTRSTVSPTSDGGTAQESRGIAHSRVYRRDHDQSGVIVGVIFGVCFFVVLIFTILYFRSRLKKSHTAEKKQRGSSRKQKKKERRHREHRYQHHHQHRRGVRFPPQAAFPLRPSRGPRHEMDAPRMSYDEDWFDDVMPQWDAPSMRGGDGGRDEMDGVFQWAEDQWNQHPERRGLVERTVAEALEMRRRRLGRM